MTEPVAATGCPRAMAPPFGLTLAGFQVLHDGERLRREGLVQLDHVHVVERHARLVERLAGGRHRADAHRGGIDAAVCVGQDPAAHRSAQLLRLLGRHQHDRRARVVHPGGVAGRDGAIGLEHGLQLGHRLHRRLRPHVLVAGERHLLLLHLHLDGNDLVVELARLLRGVRPAVRLERELVLLLAADVVRLGEVLRGDPHVDAVERVGQTADDGIDHLGLAHPRAPAYVRHPVRPAAHRLRATRDDDVGLAGLDRLRRGHDRLNARAAQPIHRECRRLLGDPGGDPHDARHVHVLRRGVDDVAEHHLLDPLRLDAGTVHGSGHRRRAKLGRGDVLQALAVGTDGGPGGGGDHYVLHFAASFRRFDRR
jgi:hypothetical protein